MKNFSIIIASLLIGLTVSFDAMAKKEQPYQKLDEWTWIYPDGTEVGGWYVWLWNRWENPLYLNKSQMRFRKKLECGPGFARRLEAVDQIEDYQLDEYIEKWLAPIQARGEKGFSRLVRIFRSEEPLENRYNKCLALCDEWNPDKVIVKEGLTSKDVCNRMCRCFYKKHLETELQAQK